MVAMAIPWHFSAKLVPIVVGCIALTVLLMSLFNQMCRKPTAVVAAGMAGEVQHQVEEKIHMDLTSDTDHLPFTTVLSRAARFFAYLVAFMASMWLIGLIPTVALFVVVFMRVEGNERWNLVLPYAAVLLFGIWIAFDKFMAIPWPPSLLGQLIPALKIIPSV
jgi:hypothetical protein